MLRCQTGALFTLLAHVVVGYQEGQHSLDLRTGSPHDHLGTSSATHVRISTASPGDQSSSPTRINMFPVTSLALLSPPSITLEYA